MKNVGGWFRAYLLPAIVFQSVLIGGAYATGREIIQYGARYGADGWWCIVAIGTGFSLMAALTFEFARRHKAYDYWQFMRALTGPLWPLFDMIYAVMVIVTVAVVIAASVEVSQSVLGMPYGLAVGLVMLVVIVLEMAGRRHIERFKTAGSILLFASFAVFATAVLGATWGNVERVFETADVSFVPQEGPLALLFVGILYVGYNLGAMPATLFVLDGQSRLRHSVIAGLITGTVSTVPFILTYLALMGHYPDAEVLGAQVPWLQMLPDWLEHAYAVIIVWTLVETSTGMIHAVVHRVDGHLQGAARPQLTRLQTGLVTGGILITATVLSGIGLIALVARGYGLLAYGFLALFALPLVGRLVLKRL